MKLPFGLKFFGSGKNAPTKEAAGDGEDTDAEAPAGETGEPDGGEGDGADEKAGDRGGGGRRRVLIIGAGAAAVALVAVGVGGWLYLERDSGAASQWPEPGVPRVELVIPSLTGAPGGGTPGPPPGDTARGEDPAHAGDSAARGPGAADAGSAIPGATGTRGPDTGVVVSPVSLVAFSHMPEVPAGAPLTQVPDPALVEQGAFGPLPKVGLDGRQPWRVYARPFDARDERPRIAVIVAGLGLSQAATEAAITRLPPTVTLAFDPYAKGLDDWIPLARESGHEVLLSLPMEPTDFPVHDPGPYALRASLAPADNLRHLEFVLSRLTGYVGVVTLMGSEFAAAEDQLRPVLEALRQRGLLFVDAARALTPLAPRIAAEIGLPQVTGDVILDENPSRSAIDIQFAELEGIVRKQSVAVALARPNPTTLERIAAWAATLEAKNLVLAPVSAIALRQRTR